MIARKATLMDCPAQSSVEEAAAILATGGSGFTVTATGAEVLKQPLLLITVTV